MKTQQRVLNIQYALMQGFHWMGFGVSFSFAAVYLQYRGYSNSALGLIMGIANIAGFILAPMLAQIVDRRGKNCLIRILWLMMAAQVIVMLSFNFLPAPGALLSVFYCVYLTYYICVNPLLTQLCTELERSICHMNYGVGRGVGSMAFALFAVPLGSLTSRFSPAILPYMGLGVAALQSVMLLILSIRLGRAETVAARQQAQEESLSLPGFIMANKRFFMMLLGVALLFFSHNMCNNFLINIVRNVGGDEQAVGGVNSFMAVLEIPVMLLYDRITRRVSCPSTIRIAALAFAAKGLCIALAPNLPMLYAAHLFQAFSFALITPALVRYVELYISSKDSAKGQSVSAAMTSLGAIFSSAIGGVMFDHMSVTATLLVGAAAAAAGAVLCIAFCGQKKAQVQAGKY